MEEIRQRIVDEAMSWLGTRYHHAAHVKGQGVDCVWLLIEVYKAVGLLDPAFDPGNYTRDWYRHHSDELYRGGCEQYARPIAQPLAGDIALFRIGNCVSHGGILTGDGTIIHANRRTKHVEIASLLEDSPLRRSLDSYWTAIP